MFELLDLVALGMVYYAFGCKQALALCNDFWKLVCYIMSVGQNMSLGHEN